MVFRLKPVSRAMARMDSPCACRWRIWTHSSMFHKVPPPLGKGGKAGGWVNFGRRHLGQFSTTRYNRGHDRVLVRIESHKQRALHGAPPFILSEALPIDLPTRHRAEGYVSSAHGTPSPLQSVRSRSVHSPTHAGFNSTLPRPSITTGTRFSHASPRKSGGDRTCLDVFLSHIPSQS